MSLSKLSIATVEQMVLVPTVYDSETGSKGTLIKSAHDVKWGDIMDARKDRRLMQRA